MNRPEIEQAGINNGKKAIGTAVRRGGQSTILLIVLSALMPLVAQQSTGPSAYPKAASTTRPASIAASEGLIDVQPRPDSGSAAVSLPSSRLRWTEAYGKLPLSFEANRGQTNAQVKFLSRGPGHTLFLTPTEAVLVLSGRQEPAKNTVPTAGRRSGKRAQVSTTVLRMILNGANRTPHVTGREELPGKAQYFIGNDAAKWRTNVPTYGKVHYQDVYPGIDLIYYGNQGQFEYDFVVRPGADPERIGLTFQGADRVEVDPQGDLVLQTSAGTIRQHKPAIYQEVGGRRIEVAGGYVLKHSRQVGFEVGAYERDLPLVIDPVLVYSTYLGGLGNDCCYLLDRGNTIAVDSLGNAYVTGITDSIDFPTTPGAFQTAFSRRSNRWDAFVTKLNATGSALVYSTYLGGNDTDLGNGIAVDSVGNAYVTGDTYSTNFPTTPGAYRTAPGQTFVTKLNPTGSALVYSTYLGTDLPLGSSIAVDSLGNAYVAGSTDPQNFPTTAGAFQTTSPTRVRHAFVTKLNATGTALVYSTLLGGYSVDWIAGIVVDTGGNAYVTGSTESTDFPTTPGAFQTARGGGWLFSTDVFVTKLNPTGSALVYSTYLGGAGWDSGQSIAVDSLGNGYVTGQTSSTNFPTTPGAFRTASAGFDDAFVTKLNGTGTALIYSTYLGGGSLDSGFGIAVDSLGNAYVTGSTGSTNFPITLGAFQTASAGSYDAFVTKLNAAGTGLVYSSYLGGGGSDNGFGIAVDSLGGAYLMGSTDSTNFPTTPGAFQTALAGPRAAFVAKVQSKTIAGYEIVSNRVLVPGSGTANVGVTCSMGNKVLGGGFSIETPDFVKIFSSEPPNDHSWNVFAQHTDPNPSNVRQVTAVAICASPTLFPGHEVVSTTLMLPASSSGIVNVTCSTGKKVLGGGFSIETPDFIRLVTSEPSDGMGNLSDHKWNVGAQNTDPNNARRVTTTGICALPTLLAGYQIVSNQIVLPASSVGNVNVMCSTGNKVFGGGFARGHSVFVNLFHSAPTDGHSNLSDHNWDVFAQNTDPNNAWPVFVSAVCASAAP